MKKIGLLFLLFLFPAFLAGKSETLNQRDIEMLIPGKDRPVTSLAGQWDVSFDGEKNWQKVDVPGSYYSEDEIVFKKTIKIPPEMLGGKAWHLFFLGVNNQIEIFFNGEYLGRYYGFGTPFTVDIPSRALRGEAGELKIVAKQADYNEKLARTLPFYAQKNYVGILRDVLLYATNSIWIDNVMPRCEVNSTHTTSVVDLKMFISSDKIVSSSDRSEVDEGQIADTIPEASVQNPVVPEEGDIDGLYVKTRVIDPVNFDTTRFYRSENFILESERTRELTMSLRINEPVLWSPDNPHLYEFEIELYKDGEMIDKYTLNHGVKSFETSGKKFALNHKKFEMKACEYYDDYYHTDFTVTTKRIRKDLKLMKLLNCNTILFTNSSPHPVMSALADSMGFAVLIATPVSTIPEKLISLDEIRVSSSNIIDRQLNYYQKNISTTAYRISEMLDETSDAVKEFNKETAKQIRALTDKLIFKNVAVNSPMLDATDVDFVSLYHSGAESNFHVLNEHVSRLNSEATAKPVVFFYGAMCNPKNHNGYADPLSVDYQAYKISQCFKISEKNNLAGNIIKSFNDYELHNPVMNTDYYDRELATTGLFSRNRKFRLSFNTVQALFTNETEPLLNSGSLSGESLVPVSYMVLTLVMIALLFLLLNRAPRFREYFVRSLMKPYNFYADIRDQRIISSMHTIILAVFISISVAIYVVTCIYINRADETLNFFFTAAIPFAFAREFLFDIIRTPQLFMLLIAAGFFLKLLLIAILIKFVGFLMRAKIYYGDTFTMAVWSANPLILLMILNLFNQRVIAASPTASLVFGAIFVLFSILVLYRLLKCFSVVFDRHPGVVYAIGTFLILLLALIPTLYYYFEYNVFPYFDYVFNVL
jgi:beta-galactosidase